MSGGARRFGWLDSTRPKADEAAWITKAVDDLLAGASLADVAREWTAAGVKRPSGATGAWNTQLINQIVRNPRHAGLLAHHPETERGKYARYSEILTEGMWPAIVERSKWEALQARLASRSADLHTPRRRTMLTGLLYCQKCGSQMYRRRAANKGSRPAWHCKQGHNYIDGRVEDLIVEAVLTVSDTGELARYVQPQQSDQAVKLTTELREVEAAIDGAAASYSAGRLSLRAFEQASANLQKRQDGLRAALARQTAGSSLDPYIGRPGALRAAWDGLTVDQRRAVLSAVIDRAVVAGVRPDGSRRFDPERVEICWRT